MTIADWTSLASSIAVIATLGLILLQMRQVNHNQRAIMQQGRSARITAQILATTEPHLAAIMTRGYASDLAMTPEQIRIMNAFAQAYFWSHEDSFFQHKAGLLDQASWDIDVASLRSALLLPVFRVGWKLTRNQTTGPFRDFVDSQMHDVKPLATYDEAGIWKHLMQKELQAAQSAKAPATPP